MTDKEKKLQHFIQEVNRVIQEMKSKHLYDFIIQKLPYIEAYHLDYITRSDSLKDAQTLDEIVLSGLKDLVAIAVEDGLGIKEYDITKEEQSNITDVCDEMDEMFPFYIDLEVGKQVRAEKEKLEIEGKANTPYYTKLTEIEEKIDAIHAILQLRFKTRNKLTGLELKFAKITLAVGLASIENKLSNYKEIEKREAEAQKLCKKILKHAKKHDKRLKKLAYLTA